MGANEEGLTLQIVIGCWGGIHVGLLKNSFHITLGWLSFQIWFLDIDKYISRLQNECQNGYDMTKYWADKYKELSLEED